jgi:hypothetical protein
MKLNILPAALAFGVIAVLSIQAGHAQTTVIPGKNNSTVIIEQDNKPTAVIDVNKDINGQTKEAAANNDTVEAKDAAKPNNADAKAGISAEVRKAASETEKRPETTGEVSRDKEGNVVEKPKKDCIKESWMGDKPSEKCG